jgi:AcrR family transcriptional regulator
LLQPGEQAALGLRERKKARTRAAIQQHALRLFREQGYEATTVSQIAEEADVSESTFFRYYPTKEAVVFEDDFDEAFFAAFRAQPPELTPIQAMRAAVRSAFGELTLEEMAVIRERTALVFSHRELREAVAGGIVTSLQEMAELIGERVGRPPEDLAVSTLAGAVMGAMMAVTLTAVRETITNYGELIDGALAQLETGFPL